MITSQPQAAGIEEVVSCLCEEDRRSGKQDRDSEASLHMQAGGFLTECHGSAVVGKRQLFKEKMWLASTGFPNRKTNVTWPHLGLQGFLVGEVTICGPVQS